MIGRRRFAGVLLGSAALLALGGCEKSEDVSFHYRLKAEVETPDGVRIGNSVIKVVVFGQLAGTTGLGGGGLQARGEAVAVDLPDGKTLFVLLRSGSNTDWAAGAFPQASAAANGERFDDGGPKPKEYVSRVKSDDREYPVRRWIEFPNGTRDDAYPMLVTFTDIKDPTSVALVNPGDLSSSFGAGYRLKAITVQVTDEAVTTGIEKRLGWLEDPQVMNNPGWAKLPIESRKAINGLFSGTIGKTK
jgi:hypothetical protein